MSIVIEAGFRALIKESDYQNSYASVDARKNAANHNGIPSINSVAPSRPTVMIASPNVLVAKPASQ